MRFYPSKEKAIARAWAHRQVDKLFDGMTQPGDVVTIAGPEAGDIGCLKHILRIPPHMVCLVDSDKSGLHKAKKKWDGITTFHGDVSDVASSTKNGFSFFNLDLCGTLNESTLRILREVSRNTLPGGVITYTFFRGREGPNSHAGKIIQGLSDNPVNDDRRAEAYIKAIIASAGKDLRPMGFIRYDSRAPGSKLRHSPMGIVIFQKLAVPKPSSVVPPVRIRSTEIELHLRDAVLLMKEEGRDSAEMAEILNMSRPTTSAILANATRGAYKEK